MVKNRSKAWFAPKRYGYGSGLPIAWQGWVVFIVYMTVGIGAAAGLPLLFPDPNVFIPAVVAVIIPSTVVLGVICACKTDGGWRWRWGGKP